MSAESLSAQIHRKIRSVEKKIGRYFDFSMCWLYASRVAEKAGIMLHDDQNWRDYRTWHELLDALCADRGYLDNMALAEHLCAATGNRTQASFDAAIKNLQNWRRGVHIPQRKNFLLLGKLLKVDQAEGLRQHWNSLYSQAKSQPLNEPIGGLVGQTDSVVPNRARAARGSAIFTGGVATALLVGLGAFLAWPGSDETIADPVASYEGIRADYIRSVSVRVGDALIIHGARGNNCGPPPEWEETVKRLPQLATGTLADGGVGTRFSRQCGGRVPARAILFTATKPGTEQTTLFGDSITISVQ